jgi:hypothetical protein
MVPLVTLKKKHGISQRGLRALADSGLVPTRKTEGVKRGPTLMSAKALEPLIIQKEASISALRAAPAIGVHPMHLQELEKQGLLTAVKGAVLMLMKAEHYYTRSSVEALSRRITGRVKREAASDCIRLRVALRACEIRAVPWPGIVQAILDGRLEVFEIKGDKTRRDLGDRLAVRNKECLSSVIEEELGREPGKTSKWIGNATASEILGINETVVWRLMKAGVLEKHGEGPLYSSFKRDEVQRVRVQMIFTSEIRSAGHFKTYREASTWLRKQGILPHFELKYGGWKVYLRTEVEDKLKLRVDALPPKPMPPPRPTGPHHGPNSPSGKLAAQQELLDASRIGYATAATILGSSIFGVQRLVANGYLGARRGTTPFHRTSGEALSKRIVFLPEIMRISGYISHLGVMSWLENAGITPLFLLKIGGMPVFDRVIIEEHIARAEFVPGAHPRWIKRKLLVMVDRGCSVHQASIACGVSYATGKRWAATAKPHGAVRGPHGEYPLATKSKLLKLVKSGDSIRKASVACAVKYETARTWAREDART